MRCLVMLLGSCLALTSLAEPVMVGDFNASAQIPMPPWQVLRFNDDVPATRYRRVQHHGVAAIEAHAQASMALLARPVTIDLAHTPVLCWRWWVDAPIAQADMRRKAGDDYAARVYLTFDLPDSALSLGTRMKLTLARSLHGDAVPDAAINYVWDNRYPVGTQHPNAYTDRAQMLVLRSGSTDTGRWVEERRRVREDLERLLGTTEGTLQQLAIATDTDNTGTEARAWFADVHFVGAQATCRFPPMPPSS